MGGILGLNPDDKRLPESLKIAQERDVEIKFEIKDYEATHPNTYKLIIYNNKNKQIDITALSIGGGMVELIKINDFGISIKGDIFETLIFVKTDNKKTFNNIYEDTAQLANSINVQLKSLNQLRSVENHYSTDIRNMNEVSDEILNTKNTNMRYADLDSQSIQKVNLWRGYLSYLYWFIVIIYSVVVMIIGQQFRFYRGWVFLVFLISYPYVSQYLASWIPSDWFINVNVSQPNI